jgi:hypothetical protein
VSEAKIPKGVIILRDAYDGREVLLPAARIIVSEVKPMVRGDHAEVSQCRICPADWPKNTEGIFVVESLCEVQAAMVRALGAQE